MFSNLGRGLLFILSIFSLQDPHIRGGEREFVPVKRRKLQVWWAFVSGPYFQAATWKHLKEIEYVREKVIMFPMSSSRTILYKENAGWLLVFRDTYTHRSGKPVHGNALLGMGSCNQMPDRNQCSIIPSVCVSSLHTFVINLILYAEFLPHQRSKPLAVFSQLNLQSNTFVKVNSCAWRALIYIEGWTRFNDYKLCLLIKLYRTLHIFWIFEVLS